MKEYLGDGLYAEDDGHMFKLRAPRGVGEHWVGLEPDVLAAFFRFIERTRKVKIIIQPLEVEPDA